ncbi:biotin--[acetyl-CoA-carboxylase] ligase [Candidatus Arthromitus sp. SFB-rat-Yit]|uniref:biotin--[acetyl-CoA-carboxylase] ligase n=1 Tax=Candidatus Arthromitus sp. SFB-rat-Yit TaxID=1041504 RepID=UPI000227A574|nr:biotin--[acetyl-CoA-carboxylase] ligase [Candidatus Arthromitus sp. SFB-rat-Yit]BAK81616.1 biotin-(acetyl-CoA carboxylase) ligase [Candidatus Arthromitus sp. SFB-rat-Yit]
MSLNNIFNADIYEFETISSTNDFAKQLCTNSPKNGTIIISNEQTKGKGRLGNTWSSKKDKGLYFSIIFKCINIKSNYETLTLMISLAISDLLKTYSLNPKIKWPNDILIDDKKVCGILCELKQNSHENFIICGIGINLYHDISDFDESIINKATSIILNTNIKIIKYEFINNLISHLHTYYNNFINLSFKPFLDKYISLSSILNKEVCLKINGIDVSGIVDGFDEFGHLLLKRENKIIKVSSGEVTLKNTYKK